MIRLNCFFQSQWQRTVQDRIGGRQSPCRTLAEARGLHRLRCIPKCHPQGCIYDLWDVGRLGVTRQALRHTGIQEILSDDASVRRDEGWKICILTVMKVLLINGSARAKGNTHIALEEVGKTPELNQIFLVHHITGDGWSEDGSFPDLLDFCYVSLHRWNNTFNFLNVFSARPNLSTNQWITRVKKSKGG